MAQIQWKDFYFSSFPPFSQVDFFCTSLPYLFLSWFLQLLHMKQWGKAMKLPIYFTKRDIFLQTRRYKIKNCILHHCGLLWPMIVEVGRKKKKRTGCSWAHILIGTIQLFKFGTIWTFIDNKILDHGRSRRRKKKGLYYLWKEAALLNGKENYLHFVILFWKKKRKCKKWWQLT